MKKITHALRPVVESKTDFNRHILFGSIDPATVPDEYFVGEPLIIKDQDYQVQGSDFCGGYAGSEVSEDQEMVELNGEFTFMVAKRLKGSEYWKEWGTDLREICNGGVKVGFLEQEYYPFENSTDLTRDFIANPANWSSELDMLAAEHRKNSYTTPENGPYDRFDNWRTQMYMARAGRKSILTGVAWRQSWTDAPGGIIPDQDYSGEPGSGHAVKCFGWMVVNGAVHLVFQLSNTNEIGDKGLFYFPARVVNDCFTYGAYMWEDMPADYLKVHHDNGMRVDANPLYKLYVILLNWITGKSI